MNIKVSLRLAVPTLLVAANLLGVTRAYSLQAGEPAPHLTLNTFSGEKVSLEELKGKIVYVDFWATWCAPCRNSLPWMHALQERYKEAGVAVLAVNEDANPADAKKVLQELQPSFRALADENGAAASTFNLPTMPSSFLVDRSGIVRFVHAGFREGDKAQIGSEIEQLLNEGRH